MSTSLVPYEIINAKILEFLEHDQIPWKRPWKEVARARSIHGHVYRGCNAMLLSMATFSSPFWATFSQIKKLGGVVKAGEKAWPIVFYKFLEVPDKENADKTKRIPILRYWHVFNIEQTTGIDETKIPCFDDGFFTNDVLLDGQLIIDGMENPPTIEHGGDQAFYRPATDHVQLPELKRFESAESYYCTAFHELVHSTGHESRLNRPDIKSSTFGTDPYAKEELVAEIGASYLCAAAKINQVQQNAAYIRSWMKRIKEEPRLFVTACAKAHKAAEYIFPPLADKPENTDE
jgi:antirestriction protein ArdC